MNGTVSVIDPDYALLDAVWTFSNCTGPLAFVFEGTTVEGFAMNGSVLGVAADAYFFLLTRITDNGFEVISVIYEPA